MKRNKESKLTLLKSKNKWWAIFAILGIVLTFTACENDCNFPEDKPEEYPFLKVTNLTNDGKSITTVKLVGYEFTNLNITEGSSQTFNLDSGMSGGYKDVNINVRLSGPQIVWRKIQVNLNKGQTTTITMKGCISYEGCKGYYLE